MKKTIKQAANVVREIKTQVNKGKIKDHRIAKFCNWDTLEETGFAVTVTLSTAYDYPNNIFDDWKTKLMAEDYVISVNRNRLIVRYNVMFDKEESK